jgi:hypothetical protein
VATKGRYGLEPQTVADFHFRVIELLNRMGVAVAINEMPDLIRFFAGPNPRDL